MKTTHDFAVIVVGSTLISYVTAERWKIDDFQPNNGQLEFYVGDERIAVFAPGGWTGFTKVNARGEDLEVSYDTALHRFLFKTKSGDLWTVTPEALVDVRGLGVTTTLQAVPKRPAGIDG